MSLHSFKFVVIITLLVASIGLVQKFIKSRKREASILVMFFFSCFTVLLIDFRFLICIFVITLIAYFMGLLQAKKSNRIAFVLGVTSILIILCYFKYAGFFIDGFTRVFGIDQTSTKIIAPIGISFYSFSAISYLIDVYNKRTTPENSFLEFAHYIAFFPKLTAGPIVRYNQFAQQTKKYRGIELRSFLEGIQIFAIGFFKKAVLADHLNVFVNDVYSAPTAFDSITVILAVFSYSLQIYYDFSGYSDMAIGISKIVGYDFDANFNLPYISQNISEFWKRWHISLSSWLQDYVYFPLGGSKKGSFRTYINLIIVMIVSGIWHGAGWTFIVWGGIHGIYSCINRLVKKRNYCNCKILNILFTFIFVTIAWIPFRANSLSNAYTILMGMFNTHAGINQIYLWTIIASIVSVVEIIYAYMKNDVRADSKTGNICYRYPILDLTKFHNLVLFFSFLGLIFILGYFGNTAFIYGSF